MIKILLLVFAVYIVLILLFFLYPVKYPLQGIENDYAYAKAPFWHMYFLHKYVSPVPNPAKGSGLKEYFQSLPALPEAGQLSETRKISISAAGDIWSRNDLTGEDGKYLWEEVGHQVFGSDISIANHEFIVQPENVLKKIGPHCTSEEGGELLTGDSRFGKFSFMSLGNNHINDSLSAGIISTANHLDRLGIAHAGANRTADEQDKFPILTCKGIKVAILSYTFSNNGVPLDTGFEHGLNLVRFNALQDDDYDPSLIHRHIAMAKEKGADLIICCNHWGAEFEYYPSPLLVKRAHDLIDAGVDIIVGNHSMVINPTDIYEAKDGRKGLILYSLGATTGFALPRAVERMALIAEITVEAGIDTNGEKKVLLTGCTLMPTYFYLKDGKQHKEHRILPLMAEAKKIGRKNPSSYLSNKAIRKILYLEKLFRKHFYQKGFRYI